MRVSLLKLNTHVRNNSLKQKMEYNLLDDNREKKLYYYHTRQTYLITVDSMTSHVRLELKRLSMVSSDLIECTKY